MKYRLKIKLASLRDFCWWMEKEELRFTHILSLMWVRLIGENAGTITLIAGPLNIKLHFAWQGPGGQHPEERGP